MTSQAPKPIMERNLGTLKFETGEEKSNWNQNLFCAISTQNINILTKKKCEFSNVITSICKPRN